MSGSLLRSVTMVALGLGCGCSTTAPVTPTVATTPLPVRESVVDTHLDGVPGGKVARLQRVMATVAELKPEQGRMVLLDELAIAMSCRYRKAWPNWRSATGLRRRSPPRP